MANEDLEGIKGIIGRFSWDKIFKDKESKK
jgi:hypothetical protein